MKYFSANDIQARSSKSLRIYFHTGLFNKGFGVVFGWSFLCICVGLAQMSSRRSSSFLQSWGTKWLVLGSVRLELAPMSQVGFFLPFPYHWSTSNLFLFLFFLQKGHFFLLIWILYISFCFTTRDVANDTWMTHAYHNSWTPYAISVNQLELC